jgi:hypothetical protein
VELDWLLSSDVDVGVFEVEFVLVSVESSVSDAVVPGAALETPWLVPSSSDSDVDLVAPEPLPEEETVDVVLLCSFRSSDSEEESSVEPTCTPDCAG